MFSNRDSLMSFTLFVGMERVKCRLSENLCRGGIDRQGRRFTVLWSVLRCPASVSEGAMLHMIKLEYIQEYLTLAETLNFSQAAELCYITQPAFSRHIAQIEEEMGAKLFERDTRNVQLTPAGEAVQRQFKSMMRCYELAKEQAGALAEGRTGAITLMSPYYSTAKYTEPVVARFKEQHPGCDVFISPCQPVEGLQNMFDGKSDLALSASMVSIDQSVRCVPYATERLAAVLLASHPLSDRKSIQVEELKDETFVAYEMAENDVGDVTHSFISEIMAKHGIRPKNVVGTQQIDTLGMTMRSCGGVSIMPYETSHMDRSYLRFIPLEDEDCTVAMCLYYRVDNDNPLVLEYVRTALEVGSEL